MAVISIKNKTKSGSLLVGNAPFIPTDYESIATVTVGSGGSSSITFSSISSTYTHLQIRGMYLGSATDQNVLVQAGNGSIDTGANYNGHIIIGSGTTATASSQTNSTSMAFLAFWYTANNPACFVIDVLDYANANKYKTFRGLAGNDSNGAGQVGLGSGAWRSTSAINTIKLAPSSGNFNQYSSFALYGIKGA